MTATTTATPTRDHLIITIEPTGQVVVSSPMTPGEAHQAASSAAAIDASMGNASRFIVVAINGGRPHQVDEYTAADQPEWDEDGDQERAA